MSLQAKARRRDLEARAYGNGLPVALLGVGPLYQCLVRVKFEAASNRTDAPDSKTSQFAFADLPPAACAVLPSPVRRKVVERDATREPCTSFRQALFSQLRGTWSR